jgi:RNA polymerase sigma-70 factor, ECF subfamily
VLGWTAPEVAELLDSTVAGVNSALQRARATIDAELPANSRTAAAPSDRRLLADYVDAWESSDVDRLVSLLRADALLRMPPGRAILGRFGIVDFFVQGPCGGKLGSIRLVPTRANGRPAVAMYKRGDDGALKPHGILAFEVDGDHVATFDAFIDERLVGMFANG